MSIPKPNPKGRRKKKGKIMKTTSIISAALISISLVACGYDPKGTELAAHQDAEASQPPTRGRQVGSDAGTPDSLAAVNPDTLIPSTPEDALIATPDTLIAVSPDTLPAVTSDTLPATTPDTLPPAGDALVDTIPSVTPDTMPADTTLPPGYVPAKIPAGTKALFWSLGTTMESYPAYMEIANHVASRGIAITFIHVISCTEPCRHFADSDGNPINWSEYRFLYSEVVPENMSPAQIAEITIPMLITNSAAKTWANNNILGVVYGTTAKGDGKVRDTVDIAITMPSAQIAAKMTGTVSLGTTAAPDYILSINTPVVTPKTAHVVATIDYSGNEYAELFYYNPGDSLAPITDYDTGLQKTETARAKIVGFPLALGTYQKPGVTYWSAVNSSIKNMFDASIDWLMGL